MKKYMLVLAGLMLFLCGCGTTSAQKEEAAPKAEEVQNEEKEEARRLAAQVVVIGGSKEAMEAALAAAEEGASSVIVLGYGEAKEEELLKKIEAQERITLLPEATAGGLLMDTTGAVRAVNSKQNAETVGIDCMSVIVGVDPQAEENSTLLSFLIKNESGGLLADENGRPMRDLNPEQAPPTKCGVPLAVAESDTAQEEGPQYVCIPGLYGVGKALEGNEAELTPQQIGVAAAKETG